MIHEGIMLSVGLVGVLRFRMQCGAVQSPNSCRATFRVPSPQRSVPCSAVYGPVGWHRCGIFTCRNLWSIESVCGAGARVGRTFGWLRGCARRGGIERWVVGGTCAVHRSVVGSGTRCGIRVGESHRVCGDAVPSRMMSRSATTPSSSSRHNNSRPFRADWIGYVEGGGVVVCEWVAGARDRTRSGRLSDTVRGAHSRSVIPPRSGILFMEQEGVPV